MKTPVLKILCPEIDINLFFSEYAYVLVGGHKSPVPVPKKIIKSEYLENAEKTVKIPEGTLSRASSSGSSVEIVNKSDLTTDFGGSPQNEEISVAKESSLKIKTESIKSNSQAQTELLVNLDQSVVQEIIENVDMVSHCSAAGTCFSDEIPSMQRSSRIFVFPEHCPGYEVLENTTSTFPSK